MIRRLSLYNFKSIGSVTVDFEPLTVLIGRSGTGKRNIVEGLRFWRDFLITRNWHKYQDKWNLVLSAASPDSNFGFEVELSVPGFEGIFHYRMVWEPKKQHTAHPSLRDETLSRDGKIIFKYGPDGWLTPPPVTQPPQSGPPALGMIYGLADVRAVHVALTQGIGCYDFAGDVLTSQERQSQDRRHGLADHAQNYLDVYETLANALGTPETAEIVPALRQLNPTIRTLDVELHGRNRIFVGHETADHKAMTLELSQQSEGFRRFLAHILALYQIPAKPTLIFEEAEKGIYPGALAALADHFKAVAESGRSQVIVTTHSPQLLDHFPAESIRVVTMENYRTKVGPLADDQRESLRENLLTAGELLTRTEPRVEAPV